MDANSQNRSDDSSTFISKVRKAMKRSGIDNQVDNLEEDEAFGLAKPLRLNLINLQVMWIAACCHQGKQWMIQ